MAAPLGCVKRNPVFLYVAEGSKGTEKLWGELRGAHVEQLILQV